MPPAFRFCRADRKLGVLQSRRISDVFTASISRRSQGQAACPRSGLHWWLSPLTLLAFGMLFSALLAAGGTAAQGVSPGGGVSGYVRDASSQDPVVSARVDLMSPNGFAAPTAYTNENGEFRFNSVGDGDYHIMVSKMGYDKVELTVSVVAGHNTQLTIDLKTTASDSNGSSAEKGPAETISAHELSAPPAARDDYAKGKDLMAKTDYDGAITAFQKATREFPDFYEAYATMGVAQYMSGHAADARASLQKSIDLSKGKYPDALFDLADVYNDISDYADAEPLAKQVVDLDPSSWHGYFERARALLGLKRYAEAEQNARKAIELVPKNLRAYVILTNTHIAMQNYAAALNDIDAYLKLDPNSSASEAMRSTRAQLAKALSDAKKGSPKSEQKPQ